MTRIQKRTMFYVAVIFFIIISCVVILYAQGYKYSLSTGEFVKTGTFFVKVNTSAEVFVDGQFLGNTSFLGNSFSKERLLPGQYAVKLQKDGYYPWEKKVSIEEGMVTEFTRVVLLPNGGKDQEGLVSEIKLALNPTDTTVPKDFFIENKILYKRLNDKEKEVLATNVIGFSLAEDNKKIAWWNSSELWVYWLDDMNYQPYHKKGDKEVVVKLSTSIKNITWFKDSDHLVIETNTNIYKIVEIDDRGGINIVKV